MEDVPADCRRIGFWVGSQFDVDLPLSEEEGRGSIHQILMDVGPEKVLEARTLAVPLDPHNMRGPRHDATIVVVMKGGGEGIQKVW